jgi:type I restriction enzyme S subunit
MAKGAATWKLVKFGELVRQVKEKADPETSGLARFVAGEHMDTDDLRIRRWGDIGDGYLGPAFHARFRPGQVLYGSRRTYLRKVAVADFDGICANTTFVLESRDPEVLLPELLPFIMQSDAFHEHSKRESKGSVNPYVNFSDLAWYECALPPMEEQRRLVALLTARREVIDRLRDASHAGVRTRDSLVRHLYERGTRGEPLKSTRIGLVPKSWSVEELGERFTVQLGKMMSEGARAGANGGTQIPYLRNANVQWNRLDLQDVATLSFTEKEREKFALRPGDILACEGRHVGKAAMWRDEIPGACYQKALHRLRPKGKDLPAFLLHCLYFCSITGRFVALTGETTIPHLPAEKLRAMEIAFPSIDEQREIADAINQLDRELSSLKRREEQATAIVPSLEAVTT